MSDQGATAIRERVDELRRELEQTCELVGSLGTTANRLVYERLPWALFTIAALLDRTERRISEEFTLCEETGEHAIGGACTTHGGDACLRQYQPVREGPPCPTD